MGCGYGIGDLHALIHRMKQNVKRLNSTLTKQSVFDETNYLCFEETRNIPKNSPEKYWRKLNSSSDGDK